MTRALGPLSLLVAYGVAFAAAALGGGVLAFDDHPGQLYRAWHVLAHGWAPWAWNPGWWAGYPELQFYPPLYSWLVAALDRVSLGRLGVGVCYQALLWITYLAPGVTVYVLLHRRLGDGWLALPGAFIALTLSAGIASGVEGGVHIGMAPARLAWALLPLVPLALDGWIENRQSRPRVVTIAALTAAIALTHPALAPTAVAALALASVAHPPRRARSVAAASMLALGVALTAVWSLPLLARLSHTRALAWGQLTFPIGPLPIAIVLLAAAAAWLVRAPADRALARLPWLAAAIVALDRVVLEPLGARWLPADRIVDGAWLAAVTAAGLATGRLLARVPRVPALASGLAAVALLAAVGAADSSLTLWPRRAEWPTLAEVSRGLRLDDFWKGLARLPEGRVLFVRSSAPLVYGEEWWRPHTHVTALTPIAGRAIVNGTFTHGAPVAALVYRGSAGPGAITSLVERLDGRSLLGRPLGALDVRAIDRLTDHLGVVAVVALDEDVPRLPALADDTRLVRSASAGPFVSWTRRDAVAIPRRLAAGHWRVRLRAREGDWTPARLAYYPLWRAEIDGKPIETRRGTDGDLEVRLASSAGGVDVDLFYSAGVPEIAGAALSTLAVIACALLAVGGRLWSRRTSTAF